MPSQPESMMPTVTPLPVSPRERSFWAAPIEEDMAFEDAVSS